MRNWQGVRKERESEREREFHFSNHLPAPLQCDHRTPPHTISRPYLSTAHFTSKLARLSVLNSLALFHCSCSLLSSPPLDPPSPPPSDPGKAIHLSARFELQPFPGFSSFFHIFSSLRIALLFPHPARKLLQEIAGRSGWQRQRQ